MLKGIPQVLSPDILKILMEMGHGDEIVLADANFPSASCSQRLVRCDGIPVTELLSAILKLFPLDHFEKFPIKLMSVVPGDDYSPTIWGEFENIIKKSETENVEIEYLERFDFYKAAKSSYAIVVTGETKRYANIILRKGII